MADYRQLKTPFFSITVTDGTFKRAPYKLPDYLLGLVEKIEIFESFAEVGQITISFVEGSREPGSQDRSLGSAGLYPIGYTEKNPGMSGVLNNRTGIITDLRFSGKHGITFISETEQKTGVADISAVGINGKVVPRENRFETEIIATPRIRTVDGVEVLTGGTVETRLKREEVRYVFQEHNLVTVEFGYRDEETGRVISRKVSGFIIVIQADFPDRGMPTTKIVCQSPKAYLDSVVAREAKTFNAAGSEEQGNTQIGYEFFGDSKDQATPKTSQLAKHYFDCLGYKSLVSTNFTNDVFDKTNSKTMTCGMTPKEFMDELCEEGNAVCDIRVTEKGECEALFMSRKDLEKIKIQNLNFNWKDPETVLRKVSVKADFGTNSASSKVGITSSGKLAVAEQDEQKSAEQGNFKAKPHANPHKVAKCLERIECLVGKGNVTGNSKPTGDMDSAGNVLKEVQTKAESLNRRIFMEVITLGHPDIKPLMVDIEGLGVRYSGEYKILKVTHIIDTSGYTCNLTAEGYALDHGGVTPVDKKKEEQKKNQVGIKQFDGDPNALTPSFIEKAVEWFKSF